MKRTANSDQRRVKGSLFAPRSSLLASQWGFTLLELTIYVGVLVVVVLAVVNVMPLLFTGRGNIESRELVREQLGFSLERIGQDVRSATAITTPASAGATGATLVLTHPTNGTVTYCVFGNRLRRAQSGAACDTNAPALTPATVTVAAPTFTRVENTNTIFSRTSIAIQVSLSMTAGDSTSGEQYTEQLQTTVTKR